MAFVGLGEGELGRFLEVNQALCEIAGCPPDELTRMTLQDISLSEHVADVVTMLLQLAGGGGRAATSSSSAALTPRDSRCG